MCRTRLARWLLLALAVVVCGCGSSAGAGVDAAPLPPGPDADAGPLSAGDVLTFDEIAVSPADGSQSDPSVAWTGTHYLVVWVDQMDRLRARRVATDGTALDPVPLTLASGHDLRDPSIVCAASSCAVTWLDVGLSNPARRLVRLDADGSLLDATPLTLAEGPVAIAALADGFVLSSSSAGQVRAIRLGASGPPLDDPGVLVFAAVPQQQELLGEVRLGCDATGCLIAFGVCEQGAACRTLAARFGADGVASASQPLSIVGAPAGVAAGGGEFLVVIADFAGSILGVRVDAAGAPLDATALPLFSTGTGQSGGFEDASAAFDGDSFLVAARLHVTGVYPGRLVAKRVATDGQVTPTLPFELSESIDQQSPAAIACGPGQCLSAATIFEATQNVDVVFTRVGGVNALDRGGVLLTVSANRQWFPAAASNGQDYLVVWEDTRASGGSIHAARLSAAGAWLDSTSVELGTFELSQSNPSAAWNGSAYQVVWTTPNPAGLVTARIGADGVLLDPEPVPLDTTGGPIARIGCGGGVCLVSLVRDGRQQLWRLGQDGQPLDDAPIDLGEAGNGDPRASVAYHDGVFAVIWTPPDPMFYGAIACTRLTPDGTLLDAEPVRLALSAQGATVVATDDDFVAVWSADSGPPTRDLDVGFAVLGHGGGVLAHGSFGPTSGNQLGSAPVFGGSDVLVPWQENDGVTGHIALERVHASGDVLDAEPFPIADVWPVTGIASASTGHGDALVIWDDIDRSPAVAATRLRLRLVHEQVGGP